VADTTAKQDPTKNALGDEPQSAAGSKEPTKADTRDTNGAGGRLAAAKAAAAEEAKDIKVLNYLADGSVEESTVGALAETHGPVMGGPTVAELNPAFAPGVVTATQGAASE
jgi:hypothetical protein